jgi:hypothetical protein
VGVVFVLMQLKTVRGADGKVTLLDFLVKTCESKSPDVIDFDKDFTVRRSAAHQGDRPGCGLPCLIGTPEPAPGSTLSRLMV